MQHYATLFIAAGLSLATATDVTLRSGGITVTIEPSSAALTVRVDDRVWFAGGQPAIPLSGSFGKSAANLTQISPMTEIEHGVDALGEYSEVTMSWGEVPDSPIIFTSIRAYSNREMFAFKQKWPRGTGSRDQGTDSTVVAPFPSFSTVPPVDVITEPLRFLQFGGCQLANTFTGVWTNSSNIPADEKLGVPLLLFAASGRSLVLGPGGNWLVAVNEGISHGIGCGIKSSVNEIPVGFEHDTLLVGGGAPTAGPNRTMVRYGDALLTKSGKRRPEPYDDFVLSHLGYWTDNGAFYDSLNVDSGFPNHEAVLRAMKQQWTKEQIPFRYVQWDDWQWRNSSGATIDTPGILHWPPDTSAIPDGMTNWLDMPTSQYCPMYSAKNEYIVAGKYKWATDYSSPKGGSAIPVDIDFYRDVFRNGSRAQMKMFEQDFLCTYAWTTNLTRGDVHTGMTWLHAMNTAAEEAGITLQLCMMCPVHVLASTELTKVTNGRGTSDNSHTGAADLYPLGHSGLLMGAVGLQSSRDNVWTSAQEQGCAGKSGCSSPDFVLQNVAAVLGGGPYGPSDGINFLNRSIIMQSCRSDGVMLRADWPLITADSALRALFIEERGSHVWVTHTTLGGLRWGMVLGVSLISPFSLPLTDVVTNNVDYIVADAWSSRGTNPPKYFLASAGTAVSVPKSPTPAGDSDSGSYQILAPIFHNNWCLLGEAAKTVPASRRRFTKLTVANDGFNTTVLAASGETVNIWVIPPTAVSMLKVDSADLEMHNDLILLQCVATACHYDDCDVKMQVVCSQGRCTCK